MLYEILSIVATILLVTSMAYSCKNIKSTIVMRSINAVAAILFIVYNVIIGGYGNIMSHIAILCIDIYYIIKNIKAMR